MKKLSISWAFITVLFAFTSCAIADIIEDIEEFKYNVIADEIFDDEQVEEIFLSCEVESGTSLHDQGVQYIAFLKALTIMSTLNEDSPGSGNYRRAKTTPDISMSIIKASKSLVLANPETILQSLYTQNRSDFERISLFDLYCIFDYLTGFDRTMGDIMCAQYLTAFYVKAALQRFKGQFTLKMMLQYGRIAIDANTNEKFNQITINHAQVKSYITSFPMNWGILYKGADDSKLKKSVNLMLAKEAVRQLGNTIHSFDPSNIHPMELVRVYVALLDSGDTIAFTPQEFIQRIIDSGYTEALYDLLGTSDPTVKQLRTFIHTLCSSKKDVLKTSLADLMKETNTDLGISAPGLEVNNGVRQLYGSIPPGTPLQYREQVRIKIAEKLGMILDPTKADECNKSYNKLLKTALRLKNSNIHEALQKICSTYYLMLDYPKFLNTSKLDIPESIENLSSSNRQLFFIRDEKLSDGYLAYLKDEIKKELKKAFVEMEKVKKDQNKLKEIQRYASVLIKDGLTLTNWDILQQNSPNFKVDMDVSIVPYFKLINLGGSRYLDGKVRFVWREFLLRFESSKLVGLLMKEQEIQKFLASKVREDANIIDYITYLDITRMIGHWNLHICKEDPNLVVNLDAETINKIVILGEKISKTTIDTESITYSEMNYRVCEFYIYNPKLIYANDLSKFVEGVCDAIMNVNSYNSHIYLSGIYFFDVYLADIFLTIVSRLHDRVCDENLASLSAKLKQRTFDMIEGVEYRCWPFKEHMRYFSKLKLMFD